MVILVNVRLILIIIIASLGGLGFSGDVGATQPESLEQLRKGLTSETDDCLCCWHCGVRSCSSASTGNRIVGIKDQTFILSKV